MAGYYFVTKWSFEASPERVWQVCSDVTAWHTWLPSLQRARIQSPVPPAALGAVVDCAIRGFLPYALHVQGEVSVFEPPRFLGVTVSGDLVGSGTVVLTSQGEGTWVTLSWEVQPTNPLLNLLGYLPPIRALLATNHHAVMSKAYRVLRARVETAPGGAQRPPSA